MTAPLPNQTELPLAFERLIVFAATIAGAALRSYHFTQVGLSHFDEGVYATSAGAAWFANPDNAFFSPPGFLLLVGIAEDLFGAVSDLAPLAVSLLFSTALIPLVWWIGRTWWDHRSGILAAWLIAADGMQIAFGRVALTDATFTFWFVLATFLVTQAMSRGGAGSMLLAALAVGFTWNTKYNGFLPIVLSLGAIPGVRAIARCRTLAALAFLAVLTYLPWAIWVEFHVEPGGYRALIKHQRGYVDGIHRDDWFRAAGGWNTLALATTSIVLLGLIAWLLAQRRVLLALVTAGAALVQLTPLLPVLWVGLACLGAVRKPRSLPASAIPWCLGVLLILPAIYTPYLRLWLPTQVFVLLAAAGGMLNLAESIGNWQPRRQWTLASGVLLLSLAAWTFAGLPPWRPLLPETTPGYRPACRELTAWAARNNKQLVTLVRPSALFYLALGRAPIRRVLSGEHFDRSMLGPNDVLVVDHTALDNPGFRRDLESLLGRGLKEVVRFDVAPSTVAKLDDHPPWELPVANDEYALRVYALGWQQPTTIPKD